MKAIGTRYILLPRDSGYGIVSLSGRHKIVSPREGDVFDFTDHAYAWVCGVQYFTTANGWSDPFDAAGKKIRITKVKPGDAHSFSIIYFEILEEGAND